MNECAWSYICVCESDRCEGCGRFLDTGSEEGYNLICEYDAAVRVAVEPVTQEFRKRFEEEAAG